MTTKDMTPEQLARHQQLLAEWDYGEEDEVPAAPTQPRKKTMQELELDACTDRSGFGAGWTEELIQGELARRVRAYNKQYNHEPVPDNTPAKMYTLEEARKALGLIKRKSPIRLTAQQQIDIVDLHAAGYKPQDISTSTGASVSSISAFIYRTAACKPINRTKVCRGCGELLTLVCKTKDCSEEDVC